MITIGLKVYFEDSYTPVLRACWRHCLVCAIVAERAASAAFQDWISPTGRASCMISAASPWLRRCLISYARVVEAEADRPADVLQREREVCGLDPCEAGLALVRVWGLPAAFAEITARHHEWQYGANGVVSLVCPSCLLVDAIGFSVAKYRTHRSYNEILAELPEAAHRGFPAEASIKKEIRVIESAWDSDLAGYRSSS